jgi:peptidoglycan-N-acetylglucosamine deacetylase
VSARARPAHTGRAARTVGAARAAAAVLLAAAALLAPAGSATGAVAPAEGAAAPREGAAVPAAASRPILITVDDLPVAGGRLHADAADRERITRDLLAALARHRIHAVALVIQGNVGGAPDEALLDLWLAGGHELGSHSWSHLDYTRADSATYLADVAKGLAGLDAFLGPRGGKTRFFRFPYLDEGDTIEKLAAARRALEAAGVRNLSVTIDDQDWSFEAPFVAAARAGDGKARKAVIADYLAALRLAVRHHEEHGDDLFGRTTPQILLLHANAVGAVAWDDLFGWLESTGHRFATADEVLADPVFSEPHQFVARSGSSLWDRLAHDREEREVRAALARLLEEQSAAWSRGDLDAFCSVYDDDALFLSPGGSFRGRLAIRERYQKKYADRAAMGTLRLDVDAIVPLWGMEVTPGGDAVPGRIHGATAAARWSLSYPDRPEASGRTLLVFRRAGDRWLIVQDASM